MLSDGDLRSLGRTEVGRYGVTPANKEVAMSDQGVEQPDSIITRLIEEFKDDPEYLRERIAILEGELAKAQGQVDLLVAHGRAATERERVLEQGGQELQTCHDAAHTALNDLAHPAAQEYEIAVWRYESGVQFEMILGEPVTFPGFAQRFFVHTSTDDKGYAVTEVASGHMVGAGESEEEAILDTYARLSSKGSKAFDEVVRLAVKLYRSAAQEHE